jgi:hypothetical protein
VPSGGPQREPSGNEARDHEAETIRFGHIL